MQILRWTVSTPNDKSAWRELLHYGPIILAKPKRGSVNRNLSNVINKRTASWDRGVLEADPTQQTVNSTAKRILTRTVHGPKFLGPGPTPFFRPSPARYASSIFRPGPLRPIDLPARPGPHVPLSLVASQDI